MNPIHQLAAPAANPAVASLADRKTRRRIERLLETRAGLAKVVGEKRSHRSDDAEYVAGLQNAVEATILEEFPEVFDEQFTKWLIEDAAAEHVTDRVSPDCSICQAIEGQHRNPRTVRSAA